MSRKGTPVHTSGTTGPFPYHALFQNCVWMGRENLRALLVHLVPALGHTDALGNNTSKARRQQPTPTIAPHNKLVYRDFCHLDSHHS